MYSCGIKPWITLVSLLFLLQVCAPSCHDYSIMRAWWEEDEERRWRFYKNVVGWDDAPQCGQFSHFEILFQLLFASAEWALLYHARLQCLK